MSGNGGYPAAPREGIGDNRYNNETSKANEIKPWTIFTSYISEVLVIIFHEESKISKISNFFVLLEHPRALRLVIYSGDVLAIVADCVVACGVVWPDRTSCDSIGARRWRVLSSAHAVSTS